MARSLVAGPGEGADGDEEVELALEAEELLAWLAAEKGRSANTLAAYRRDLLAYTRWLATRGLSLGEVRPADLDAYVAELRALGRAPASVSRAMVAVRSLHRFLAVEGTAAHDPSADVDVPAVPRGLPKALREDEVTALLDQVEGDDPVARRDRAMLEVLYGTGMRISELVGLSLADVDLEAGLVRVLGKGGRERVVPLGGMARRALVTWLGVGGREALVGERTGRRVEVDAVFVNQRGGRLSRQGAWGVVRRHAVAAGLGDRLTPHVLRHSCATHMLDHGADIRAVQELLGHASISTTQVYTLVSTERLWQVYAAAHPRAGRYGGRP
ncbi:MAG: site-specific tyrosine recombinase XerD [Acidimicrobiales bacterium]